MKPIHLGFEIDSGRPIEISPAHLIVTGITQRSGKTTTLEALIKRSGLKAIVFRTKPGEKSFSEGTTVSPFFRDRSDYEFVKSLIEAYSKEKLFLEKGTLMQLCKGSKDLPEIKRRVDDELATGKLRGIKEEIYTRLQHYMGNLIPQIQYANFTSTLSLVDGINIVNLERFTDEAQSLIIESTATEVLKTTHNVIMVIPEAWKLLPQKYNNPCKRAVESFIRQGATNHNFIWIDSQDMAGVDKTILKSISTWLLGYQAERNEVKHTLDQISSPKRLRPTEDQIMTLKVGHFYLSTADGVTKVYVQPIWLTEEQANLIATGKVGIDQIEKPLSASLPPVPSFEQSQGPQQFQDFSVSIQKVRTDFSSKIEELTNYLRRVMDGIGSLKQQSPSVDIDSIVAVVTTRLPNFELMKQQILDEVLSKAPRAGGGATYQVAPVEALKKRFLQDEKEHILEMIGKLDPDQKRLLKFIEAAGKGVNQTEICERCFGIKNAGTSFMKVKDLRLSLRDLGFARVDDKARTFPVLKDKLASNLQFHGATSEEVDQVYNHIVADVLV